MPEPGIFRKSSLEKLSTPEQLDHLMQVTTPRGWMALWALCGILLLALIWSVFGRLPTTISGRGILLPPRGMDEVYASGSGLVTELLVKEGDVVEAGQVIARIEQKDMERRARGSKNEQELKLAATKDRIRFLEGQIKAKKEALQLGLIAQADYESEVQALADARSAQAGLVGQSAIEGSQLRDASEVVSPKAGRVIQLTVSPHSLVNRGDPIITMSDESQGIVAYAFIPDVGNQAAAGMKVQVSPLIFKKEEFGFMNGRVTFVSEYPVGPHTLSDLLHNTTLVEQMLRGGAPYLIKSELQPDASTPSGYRWSSSAGPAAKIHAGMLCDIRVVVREQRPIAMVIPALQSLLGL